MRRGEIGHHHHVAGPYLIRFAQEAAWREDHRKEPNGFQVDRLVGLAMHNKPSVDFCGYWQRIGPSRRDLISATNRTGGSLGSRPSFS